MKSTTLADGTSVSCLTRSEAHVLDSHVQGYFGHGIEIRDNATVVDVGANIGVFDVRVVQRRPSVRVFACEPVPAIYKCLKENAERYGDGKIVPLACGISSRAGSAEITYYPNSPALSTSQPEQWTSEALEVAVAATLKHPPSHLRFVRFLPRSVTGRFAAHMRRRAETVECELKTISGLIHEYEMDQIDLLKIDCEGAEYDCLMGIDQVHWKNIRQVVIEVHDISGELPRVKARLGEMGFDQMIVEQEAGMRGTRLFNVFARRTQGTQGVLPCSN